MSKKEDKTLVSLLLVEKNSNLKTHSPCSMTREKSKIKGRVYFLPQVMLKLYFLSLQF